MNQKHGAAQQRVLTSKTFPFCIYFIIPTLFGIALTRYGK